ncbi:hypothetical protein ABH920_007181 [Catenulispora sp. EB89]|uniref:hypothetical protein n=1 Tax=Catenulispora sp. EB89 TaxID=3156257 RepID=UPI0035148F05
MQTLLAYAFDEGARAAEDAAAGLKRVAEHYDPLWPAPVWRRGRAAGRTGLYVFDEAESRWRWPSWAERADLCVATLYLPLGYERVVGDLEPSDAALPLAAALGARPNAVLELTPPFVIAVLDPESAELSLHTDAVGVGRLYELRFPGGWVWSNRPAAAVRFAGVYAEPDRAGWRTFAASGWFMGDSTPLDKVTAVPGGAVVRYRPDADGRQITRLDAVAAWAEAGRGDALRPDRVEAAAEALRGFGRSLARMHDGSVSIGLSGGRDSRLVAAAMLAAGVDVRLQTNGAEPGEADVAEHLVSLLPPDLRPEHTVNRPKPGAAGQVHVVADDTELVPNVVRWHRAQDGLRPATSLATAAPSGLTRADYIAVSGAAGEIARGYFYPPDHQEIAALPTAQRLDAYAAKLSKRILRRPGISAAALQTSESAVRADLLAAMSAGLADARMLDYFYAAERTRKWGTVPERIGTVVPLLVPEFVQAGFGLTAAQREQDALHTTLIAHLVPQWANQAFYQPPPGAVEAPLRPRLGHAPDRERVGRILAAGGAWTDAYDLAAVLATWRRMLDGTGDHNDEQLVQRALWAAVFEDYIAEINGTARPAPQSPVDVPLAAPKRPFEPVVKVRRVSSRWLRKASIRVAPK